MLEAIYVFNKSGLRYSWPVFLPTKLNYFFHGLDIPGEIQYKPILETENGGDQLVSPRLTHPALVRVPGKFRIEGEPAIPGKDQKSRYLSSKYHEACNEPLRMLGVEEMSYGRFQEDFREFVSQSHDEFMGMNPEWHEAVAQIIVENDPRLISSSYAFANLDIVPLKGKNKWTTGGRNSTTLFFASELDSINAFPRGIGLRQIEETAQKTEHRRRLFELLGARDPTKHVPEIKYQIDRQHTSLDTSWLMLLTMEDLVSHVLFLFVNQTKWSGNIDLWIMTRSGKRCRASGTYLEPLSFGSRQLNVPILHEAYLQAVGPDERRSLLIFLENGLGIASFPRLVSSVGDTLRLTREMKTIVNWAKDDTIGFLELLEQHWDHYRRWLYRDGGEKGQSEFRRQIIEAKVLCTDGILHPLNRTVLPSPSLLDVGHELPLPLLPTARADFPRWKFLLDLDVLDRVRVDTWIECLRTMASKTSETPTQAQVDAIYQRIESALKVSDRHLADVQ